MALNHATSRRLKRLKPWFHDLSVNCTNLLSVMIRSAYLITIWLRLCVVLRDYVFEWVKILNYTVHRITPFKQFWRECIKWRSDGIRRGEHASWGSTSHGSWYAFVVIEQNIFTNELFRKFPVGICVVTNCPIPDIPRYSSKSIVPVPSNPPHWEHNLPLVKFIFWSRLRWIFMSGPKIFAFHLLVNDLLFVTSYHPFQNIILSFGQHITDVGTDR